MIQDDDEKLTSVYVWFAPNEDAGEDTRGVPRLLRSHRRRLEEPSTTRKQARNHTDSDVSKQRRRQYGEGAYHGRDRKETGTKRTTREKKRNRTLYHP